MVRKSNGNTSATERRERLKTFFDNAELKLHHERQRVRKSLTKQHDSIVVNLPDVLEQVRGIHLACFTEMKPDSIHFSKRLLWLWEVMQKACFEFTMRTRFDEWKCFETGSELPDPQHPETSWHQLVINWGISHLEILCRHSIDVNDWFRIRYTDVPRIWEGTSFQSVLGSAFREVRDGRFNGWCDSGFTKWPQEPKDVLVPNPATVFRDECRRGLTEDELLLPRRLFKADGIRQAAKEISRLPWFNYIGNKKPKSGQKKRGRKLGDRKPDQKENAVIKAHRHGQSHEVTATKAKVFTKDGRPDTRKVDRILRAYRKANPSHKFLPCNS